jgi:SAM-dependent methyltransferase
MGLRSSITNFAAGYPVLHDFAIWLKPRDRVFGRVYATGAWCSEESGSGTGSELAATEAIRAYLPELFRRLGVRDFVDAPCGDWNWMRLVDLDGVSYVGLDVVQEVIAANQAKYARPGVSFTVADLTRDALPRADLVLCRDCWIHLSFRDIAAMLENIRRSGATWLLVTNGPNVTKNHDQMTRARWRYLNLRLAPFHFPQPIEALKDHYPEYPEEITLWRVADLPEARLGKGLRLWPAAQP